MSLLMILREHKSNYHQGTQKSCFKADDLALFSKLLNKCLKRKLKVWKGALESKGWRVRKLKNGRKEAKFPIAVCRRDVN